MSEPKWNIVIGRSDGVDTIAVQLGDDFSHHMTPDEARGLARELVAMADDVDPDGMESL